MYQIGDRVVYGIHGVCEICDLEERSIDRKFVLYYVLQPVDQSASKYYVPSHNPAALAKLRPILSKEQVLALLASEEVRKDCWIADESQRKNTYREMISSCDRESLLQMINTLHRHKKACAEQGRKFHLCDENFLRDAQRVLSAEFAAVLEMPVADVPAFVLKSMEQ